MERIVRLYEQEPPHKNGEAAWAICFEGGFAGSGGGPAVNRAIVLLPAMPVL